MNLALRYSCLVGLLWFAACDPVLDNAVAALGGEASGVRPGPTHRPGQPCLLCHDGELGDPRAFSVAGSVFLDPSDVRPAVAARVKLMAADGSSKTLTSNRAGNFYVEPAEWTPVYPLQVSIDFESQTVTMVSNIGRNGACAGCHVDPAGSASPGHVYAVPNDAGMPP